MSDTSRPQPGAVQRASHAWRQRLLVMLLLLLFLLLGNACGPSNFRNTPLWDREETATDIREIRILIDYNGNPTGENRAKFITDEKEIADMVASFQRISVGPPIETIYGNSSEFRFYTGEYSYFAYVFSSEMNHALYRENGCYEVYFDKQDPWSVYARSNAPEILVDVNGKPLP